MIKAKVEIKLDKKLPQKVVEAIKDGIEYGALAFEKEAKEITTIEKHVRTGRYRASINLNEKDGQVRIKSPATQQGDGVHELNEKGNSIILETGSNVEYAIYLERRYQILARALDRSSGKIKELFIQKVKEKLGL